MPGRIDLLFQSLHSQAEDERPLELGTDGSDGLLVASYEAPDIHEGLSTSVRRSFFNRDAQAYRDASEEHPGCLVSISPSLADNVDVIFSPLGRDHSERPLRLELRRGSAIIRAQCDEETYHHFIKISKEKSIVAGDYRHNLRLTLGRALRLKDEFGYSIPILNIQVRIEPTSDSAAQRALTLDIDTRIAFRLGKSLTPVEPPKATKQLVRKRRRLSELLESL